MATFGLGALDVLTRQPRRDDVSVHGEDHEHEQWREPPGFAMRSSQRSSVLPSHWSKSAVTKEEATMLAHAVVTTVSARKVENRTSVVI